MLPGYFAACVANELHHRNRISALTLKLNGGGGVWHTFAAVYSLGFLDLDLIPGV
jgi:hypothetical protein